jgi:predicted DNA-binding protein (MmcQ/YjbR family)
MDREAVMELCRGMPGATEEYPFGPEVAVFKVGRKMFALVSLDDETAHLSLKCEPGLAELLREQYAAVGPGYHLNKRHWNTVRLDGSVPEAELRDWVAESYALVQSGRTRTRTRRGAAAGP